MKNKLIILLVLLNIILLAQNETVFTNPILAGFYPDPSICRVGENYYLVNSTFSFYPGITIFKSKNLVNWELIGYAMNRPEQMNLDSLGVSRGIFAPAIRYNKGIYYITCTLVDAGGNFVVSAKNPEGPWSDPVWIPQINGIDPSFFFDENGKAYILYNSIPPDNKPLYDGHRTIRMYEFDLKNMKVTGEEKILINGGTDISKKPVWIEGPHIIKKDGYYILIAAEGGTAEQHSEVVFRSKSVTGPYLPYEKNPVLTQRHLNPDRKNPVTCTGHADLVESVNGDWWAVFLGCRPYEPYAGNYFNTGRETFLAPVKWIDGWPVINPDYDEVQYTYPLPIKGKVKAGFPYSGNFSVKDEFDSKTLNLNWMFLRNTRDKWYTLNDKKGYISLKLRPETCSGNMNPSFICRRQQHQDCEASVSMLFSPKSENEKAGLVIFQNESHYYFLAKTLFENKPAVILYKSGKDQTLEQLAVKELSVEEAKDNLGFKIKAEGKDYAFYYSTGKGEWKLLKSNVDGTFLSTKAAGGFVGSMFAMYATSTGAAGNNHALFDWFEYTGNDKVFNE